MLSDQETRAKPLEAGIISEEIFLLSFSFISPAYSYTTHFFLLLEWISYVRGSSDFYFCISVNPYILLDLNYLYVNWGEVLRGVSGGVFLSFSLFGLLWLGFWCGDYIFLSFLYYLISLFLPTPHKEGCFIL